MLSVLIEGPQWEHSFKTILDDIHNLLFASNLRWILFEVVFKVCQYLRANSLIQEVDFILGETQYFAYHLNLQITWITWMTWIPKMVESQILGSLAVQYTEGFYLN